jgi:hypothetical protein
MPPRAGLTSASCRRHAGAPFGGEAATDWPGSASAVLDGVLSPEAAMASAEEYLAVGGAAAVDEDVHADLDGGPGSAAFA